MTGMATQMEYGPATAGSRQMRMPLRTAPRPTETMNDVLGLSSAWK